MKPKGFLLVTLLLGLFSLGPLLWFGNYYAGPLWDAFWTATFIAIGSGITLCFWLGFNWARITIQVAHLFIGVTLLSYLTSDTQQPLTFWEWNSWVAQTAFGVFLLYWLNTKQVRTYCKERKMRAAASKRRYQDSDSPPIAAPY